MKESSSTSQQQQQQPLRVAMMGSGLFATSAHGPTIRKYTGEIFDCKAIWSRKYESAMGLLTKVFHSMKEQPKVYHDDDGLNEMLSRTDIDAIIMSLPLDVQPSFVEKVLQAGKHLFTEKPIAPSIEEGKRLIDLYNAKYKEQGLIWSVGENFRYESSWIELSKQLSLPTDAQNNENSIGQPILFSLAIHSPFKVGNQYLNTSWRSHPSWGDAGLFVDAFVHGIAGLRLAFGANYKASKVISCTFESYAEHIPGYDTMVANIQFTKNEKVGENGQSVAPPVVNGVISATYASKGGLVDFVITGTRGRIELRRNFDLSNGKKHGYILKDKNGKETFYPFDGIPNEFVAFAKSCLSSSPPLSTTLQLSPEEALADISLVEACLTSHTKNKKDSGDIIQNQT